ncbi:MAG: hypothetical protein ACKVH8_21355 [Pirellulales bacterium]
MVRFLEKSSPIVIDTAQSDGWLPSVGVSFEMFGGGHYNRLEDSSV